MSNENKWRQSRVWCWQLVALDGEILDEVSTFLGSRDAWHVASTGRKYVTLKEAQDAAEKSAEKSAALQEGGNGKKYPTIGRVELRKKNTCAKCRCGAIGIAKVHIEVSWFRDEDEVVWACEEHKRQPEYLLGAMQEDDE